MDLATWVRCYLPKVRALQINDFRFLNFQKSPFEARDIVVFTKLVKILWWLPTLTKCSMPSRGATDLGPYSMARALHSDGSRFLNFQKSPFHAWDIVLFTKLVKILWWLPTLTKCSMSSRGATVLGPCSVFHGKSTSLWKQARKTSVWTQTVPLFERP